MGRTRTATRVHRQMLLVRTSEISFSVVQLVVTHANFILAELGVKNSFDAYVFSLVFAIIVAAFNIIYAGGVSNSSSLASPTAQVLITNCEIPKYDCEYNCKYQAALGEFM